MKIKTYSNKTLTVSGSHLIPVSDGTYKYAKKLFRDDEIITYDSEKKMQVEEKIKSILIEPIEGYVAPLTMSGTLLVNNVLASCYAVVDSHTIAHTAMLPARWWYSLNQHISYIVDNKAVSNKNGTHWYPQILMSVSDILLNKFLYLD
jgi:hypothetical protein